MSEEQQTPNINLLLIFFIIILRPVLRVLLLKFGTLKIEPLFIGSRNYCQVFVP